MGVECFYVRLCAHTRVFRQALSLDIPLTAFTGSSIKEPLQPFWRGVWTGGYYLSNGFKISVPGMGKNRGVLLLDTTCYIPHEEFAYGSNSNILLTGGRGMRNLRNGNRRGTRCSGGAPYKQPNYRGQTSHIKLRDK